MSGVEAGILAGVFVACLSSTIAFAAVLMGMFPALSCPSCKRKEHEDLKGDGSDDWLCCVACNWCCWRYCRCCRPERLRKSLLDGVEEAKRQQEREDKELEEAERKAKEAERKAKEALDAKGKEEKKAE